MANVSHRAPPEGLPPSDSVQNELDELRAYVVANAVAGPPGAAGGAGPQGPPGTDGLTLSVATYGAVADGVTDDRVAIQAAIDACFAAGGGVVALMAGTHIVSRNGSNFYCLLLKSGVTLRGGGRDVSTIKQVAGITASVRTFYTDTAVDAAITDLTLDGNKAAQSVSEHRHGVYINGATRLIIARVTAKNFTGDGLYIATDSTQTSLEAVYCTGNNRNGITLGATCDDTTVVDSRFIGNAAQQFDSEPGANNYVTNTKLLGCTFDGAGVSNDYVLACSGYSAAQRSGGWQVTGCTINGPVRVVWCDDVSFTGCRFKNTTDKVAFEIARTCVGVTMSGCTVVCTNATADLSGIYVWGTGAGDSPDHIVVSDTTVTVAAASQFGFRVQGCGAVSLLGNKVKGAGAGAGYAGIYIRSTMTLFPFRSMVCVGNTVDGCGENGIRVAGGLSSLLNSVDISHNIINDVYGTMLTGINLADDDGACVEVTCIGNQFSNNITTPISWPAVPVLIGGNRGTGGVYSLSGSPEGVVTEVVGAIATNRSGGAGTTLYVKESGTGNTGWDVL